MSGNVSVLNSSLPDINISIPDLFWSVFLGYNFCLCFLQIFLYRYVLKEYLGNITLLKFY